MTIFTTDSKFADANNDGVIGFGAANKKKYGTATAYYLGERDGLYHYGTTPDDVMPADPEPAPPPPPVVPPPPPPPPVDEPEGPDVVQNPDGSVYLSQHNVAMLVKDRGSTPSLKIDGTEYIGVGLTVQGLMLVQGTAKIRQANYLDPAMTNGVNVGPHWRGSTAGVMLDQFIELVPNGYNMRLQIANTGDKPITRLYHWCDYNPSDNTQKLSVTEAGARQGKIVVTSTDAHAFFFVSPVMDPRVGTALPSKTVLQAEKVLDRSIAIGFLLNIAPGQSDTVAFEVRKA